MPTVKEHVADKIGSIKKSASALPIQNIMPSITEYALTGIVHGEGAPMAIIDESVYIAGDSIDDNTTILEITKDSVLVEKSGKQIILKVK